MGKKKSSKKNKHKFRKKPSNDKHNGVSYSAEQTILVIGDGDFSFSRGLSIIDN